MAAAAPSGTLGVGLTGASILGFQATQAAVPKGLPGLVSPKQKAGAG